MQIAKANSDWVCVVAEPIGMGRVPQVRTSVPPDFLSRLMALAHFMRLSLMKAAHADAGGAPCRKSGTLTENEMFRSLLLSIAKAVVGLGPSFSAHVR